MLRPRFFLSLSFAFSLCSLFVVACTTWEPDLSNPNTGTSGGNASSSSSGAGSGSRSGSNAGAGSTGGGFTEQCSPPPFRFDNVPRSIVFRVTNTSNEDQWIEVRGNAYCDAFELREERDGGSAAAPKKLHAAYVCGCSCPVVTETVTFRRVAPLASADVFWDGRVFDGDTTTTCVMCGDQAVEHEIDVPRVAADKKYFVTVRSASSSTSTTDPCANANGTRVVGGAGFSNPDEIVCAYSTAVSFDPPEPEHCPHAANEKSIAFDLPQVGQQGNAEIVIPITIP